MNRNGRPARLAALSLAAALAAAAAGGLASGCGRDEANPPLTDDQVATKKAKFLKSLYPSNEDSNPKGARGRTRAKKAR
jgi:hypothetical protein